MVKEQDTIAQVTHALIGFQIGDRIRLRGVGDASVFDGAEIYAIRDSYCHFRARYPYETINGALPSEHLEPYPE